MRPCASCGNATGIEVCSWLRCGVSGHALTSTHGLGASPSCTAYSKLMIVLFAQSESACKALESNARVHTCCQCAGVWNRHSSLVLGWNRQCDRHTWNSRKASLDVLTVQSKQAWQLRRQGLLQCPTSSISLRPRALLRPKPCNACPPAIAVAAVAQLNRIKGK